MHSKIAAFILKVVLLNSVLPNGYAQQQELTPPPSIQKICSQCHALEVRGTCLAGDCASSRVVRIAKPQPWDKVLDRMSSKGAHISDSQRREITSYLQAAFPAKLYPLTFFQASGLPGA